MAKTWTQKVAFAAKPEELFRLYTDSKLHTASTGGEASVSALEGEEFSAWDGYIHGRNLRVVPGKLVVQTWRGSEFKDDDPDSILILSFEKEKKGGRVTMIHANVPDKAAADIRKGWSDFYWKPWKAYLAARAKR